MDANRIRAFQWVAKVLVADHVRVSVILKEAKPWEKHTGIVGDCGVVSWRKYCFATPRARGSPGPLAKMQ